MDTKRQSDRASQGLSEARVKRVDLWYPGTGGDCVDAIEIDLMHVRAARSIRVSYDFERDGYVVSAQRTRVLPDGELDHEEGEEPWGEVAFVAAWDDIAPAPAPSVRK